MIEREPTDGQVEAIAEAVVDLLVARGLVVDAGLFGARVLNVKDVAQLLGRTPSWVYEHAAELGVFRYGDGPKALLGFDVYEIERWKRDRRIRTPDPPARQPDSQAHARFHRGGRAHPVRPSSADDAVPTTAEAEL